MHNGLADRECKSADATDRKMISFHSFSLKEATLDETGQSARFIIIVIIDLCSLSR